MKKGIRNYIEYLKREHGFEISFYNGTKPGNKVLNSLLLYSIHLNPYCIFIKSEQKRHKQCLAFLDSIRKSCDQEIFETVCMCGVKQYIVPIRFGADLFGFICVGSAKGDKALVAKYARSNGVDESELLQKFDHYLEPELYDRDLVLTLIKPLAAMISVMFMQSPLKGNNDYNNLYENILYVIHHEPYIKIKIEDIAKACHCSVSTVSHVFKKNSGMTINRYVSNLRIEKAKRLIVATELSITEIAYSCGFSDTNYFVYAFGKEVGISPLKYRKQHQKK